MKNEILKILNKRITAEQKIELITKIVEEDRSSFYGLNEKVKLDADEYLRLLNFFGKQVLENYIFRLDGYLYKSGKSYASHYLTILNWSRKDGYDTALISKPKTYKCSFGAEHKVGSQCNCL